jgi:hypothetical protein
MSTTLFCLIFALTGVDATLLRVSDGDPKSSAQPTLKTSLTRLLRA